MSGAIHGVDQPVLGLGREQVLFCTLSNHSNDRSTHASTYCTTSLLKPAVILPFPSLPPAQPRQMPGLHLSTAERLELTRSDRPLVCPSSQFSQYPAYRPTPDTNTTI